VTPSKSKPTHQKNRGEKKASEEEFGMRPKGSGASLAPAEGKVYLETKKERCKKLCTFNTFPETHHCTNKRSLAPKHTRGPKQQSPSKLLESPELGTRISGLKENGKTLPLRIRPNSTPPKRLQKKSMRRRERRGGKNPKLQSLQKKKKKKKERNPP
jgi:phage FluMu protein Com